jgi:hypothetical protein
LSVGRLQEENVKLMEQVEEMREEMDQVRAKMIDAGIFVGRKILSIDPTYILSQSIVSSYPFLQNDIQ